MFATSPVQCHTNRKSLNQVMAQLMTFLGVKSSQMGELAPTAQFVLADFVTAGYIWQSLMRSRVVNGRQGVTYITIGDRP